MSESEGVGVLFSGGVDSSLAALLAQRFCSEVTLFTACAEGSHDEESVSRAARNLGLKLEIVPFDAETAWETLPELIYAIETAEQIDVEIALPFFLAARAAKASGKSILISGQGPDELFGGYAKHARLYAQKGEDALDEELRSEVRQTHKVNIARDEKAIAYNGLSPFFPYLNSQFVCDALAVPSRWKMPQDYPSERKAIFRQLAINMGLPEIIALSPKKATQYSSGSQKALSSAIAEKTKWPLRFENKSKRKLTQVVLNGIAVELGMPILGASEAEPSIDLRAARKFARKIGKTNPPQ
jgi:asparagine synthase (glutamine-hydrolysing)